MKRVGQVIKVKEEYLEKYKKLHAAPWPEVNEMIKKCNIQNYSIYYRDGYLFSYFEYVGENYEEDMKKMAADPTTRKWWKETDPCQMPVESAKDGEWWADLEEVYHLDWISAQKIKRFTIMIKRSKRMTSRERVMAAIGHRQPDYVPLDLGSTPSSGISAIAYNNLKKHLGITGGQTRIYDVVQQVAQPEMEILDRFGVDVLDIGRVFNEKDEDWHEVTLADGSIGHYPNWFHPEKQPNGDYHVYDEEGTLIAKMPVGATFFDQTYFPYVEDYPDNYEDLDHQMGKVLWSALVHSPWDHGGDKDFYKTLREKH